MRRTIKIAVIVVVLVIGLPLLVAFLAVQSGFLRQYAESRLNALVPAGLPLSISIAEMSDPDLTGLAVRNILVIGTEAPADTVLSVGEIRVTYRLIDLLRGRLLFGRAEVDRLRVRLPADSVLAVWKSRVKAKDGISRSTAIDIRIDTLSITGADFRASGRDLLQVDDFNLSGMVQCIGGALSWKVDRAEFSLPGLSIDSVGVHNAGSMADLGWYVDSVALTTPRTVLDREDSLQAGRENTGRDSQQAVASPSGERPIRPRIKNIQLSGMVQNIDGVLNWKIDRASFSSPELGLESVAVQGAGRSAAGGWFVDSLSLVTPQSVIYIHGPIGRGEPLHITTDPLTIEEIAGPLGSGITGLARYDGTLSIDSAGTISGEGTLSGELQDRKIQELSLTFRYGGGRVDLPHLRGTALGAGFSGAGYVDLGEDVPVYEFIGQVDGFNLNNTAFNSFATNLSGWVTMSGRGLTNDDMALEFDLTLGHGRFDDYTFDSAGGRLAVDVHQAVFEEDFSIVYKNTTVHCAGSVEFDDAVDIFANVYFEDLSDFEGQTFIDSLCGRGYAYCNLVGKTATPDLIGHFESDSLRVFDLQTDFFTGHFNVARVFDDRSGEAVLNWGQSVGWSLPIDSLATRLRFAGTEVFIDSARAYFPAASVFANGRLNWAHDIIPIRLFDFSGKFGTQGFYAPDTISWAINDTGFVFQPFTVISELGRVSAEGQIDFDARLDGRISVENFQFAPYWQRAFPGFPLSGRLSLQARLSGNFDYPRISGTGKATELAYLNSPLGELNGTFSYQARQLRVDSISLHHPEWHFEGNGVFPVDLAFASVTPRVLPIPQNFTVTGKGQALTPVTWFLPDVVESIAGDWSMSIQLTGTPQQPRFGGWARLTDGVIKAVEIENPIEDLDVELELHQDTITVHRAAGSIKGQKTKVGPNIAANGRVIVQSVDNYLYNLQITAKEIPIQFEFQDYELTADVDVAVVGSSPPKVSGTIKILRAEDREPFSYESDIVLPDTTLWDWDIAVVSPGNYWIRNDDVQAELELDLRLLREYGIISVLGNAQFVAGRGKVYVFDRVGRIDQGELTFDRPGSSDPRLDLTLTFRIPSATPEQTNGAGGQTEYARDVDLTLLVTGYASEPLISSAEGSPYSDQDILLLLAANRATTQGTASGEGDLYFSRIRFAATNLFFSQVEREMARTLGIETVNVRTGATAAETELTVGSYFMRNFYVYGSSRVSLDRGQEVGFEYRIRRGLYFDGRRDKMNQYRLNLHLNLEY